MGDHGDDGENFPKFPYRGIAETRDAIDRLRALAEANRDRLEKAGLWGHYGDLEGGLKGFEVMLLDAVEDGPAA